MKKPLFVRISGSPLLDFANTWVQHADSTEDRLASPTAVKVFFHEVFGSEILPNGRNLDLAILRRKNIRTLLDQLIKAKINPNLSSFWPFNKKLTVKIRATVKNRHEFQLISPVESVLLNQTLQFFQSYEPHRLKKCKSPTCSHFFYDTSKASTRVWCSMKTCGNLAKIRNFRKSGK